MNKDRRLLETATGCEYLARTVQAEVLERHPSGADFMRIVRVRVFNGRHTITGLSVE